MKAAVYARYSSDNQREESIDAQLRAIREYTERNNIRIVKIYTDEAKSAMTADRPGFLKMIEDSKNGLFDTVIVHKLDRFARNRYDSAFYKRELSKNGVTVLSVLENLDDSPESIILESVLEGMAEYYSANLSREVQKGMKENALQCKHNGGRPPLGYDVGEDQTYVINEKEAATVRLIFNMYAKGFGYGKIIDELNRKGYRTKLGRKFGKSSLHDILVNEKYRGVYIFNRAAAKRSDGKRNNRASKNEEEIIRIEGGMPRIIDEKTWKAVQERMGDNKKNSTFKAREIYLLAGIIKCGKCGGAMVGNRRIAGKAKRTYTTYECSTRKRTKTCDMKAVNKEFIENLVIEELERRLFSDEAIEKLSKKIYEYALRQNKEIQEDIERFKKQLKDIQQKLDNMANAVAEGLFNPTMINKMAALENEKADIELMLEEAKIQLQINSPDLDSIKRYLSRYQDIKNKSKEDQKKIIHTFVKCVIVYDDKIIVDFIVDTNGGGGAYRFISTIDISHYRRAVG